MRGMLTDMVAKPEMRFEQLEYVRDNLTQVERCMGPPTTILVLDYGEGMKSLVRTILRREHYDVVEAGSAYETLDMMRTKPPDLVILPTDFLVPEGGWTLGEQIWELREGTPVIFVSQWNEAVTEPPAAGPHAVLARPIRSNELLKAVANLLRRER